MQKNISLTLGPDHKLALLRDALIEGEESGTADYSLKALIDELDSLP